MRRASSTWETFPSFIDWVICHASTRQMATAVATEVDKVVRPRRMSYTADDVIDPLLGLQPA